MGDALLSKRPALRIRASRVRLADLPAVLAIVALGGIIMAMSLMAIIFCFVWD